MLKDFSACLHTVRQTQCALRRWHSYTAPLGGQGFELQLTPLQTRDLPVCADMYVLLLLTYTLCML